MSIFISGFLLSLSLCFDIGIVNVATVRTGINHGFKPAFFMGLGSCFGDLIYAIFSAAALSLIIKYFAIRLFLWLGGTCVLLYLAYQMLQDYFKKDKIEYEFLSNKNTAFSNISSFSKGTSLALASPSAILWFASIGGSVIASHAQEKQALIPFFIGFLSAGVIWSFIIAIVSGKSKQVAHPKIVQRLSLASAFLFLYFAVKVFWDGYHSFIIR